VEETRDGDASEDAEKPKTIIDVCQNCHVKFEKEEREKEHYCSSYCRRKQRLM
jgi:hypothetical protein